ncbi:MAG: signal peptidase II [Chloroflexota bacterium]|nr:signal peptidase II [Chloroflexota bacterium]
MHTPRRLSSLPRALAPLYATALVVIVLDQLSKAWVVDLLGTAEGSYQRLVGDLLWLRMVHNTGAAFGMGRGSSLFFALAAVAVAAGIVFYSRRLATTSWLVRVALGLELGGALGNLIDRIRLGYVVDFIDVRLPFWPYVFNVADAAITIGVILLLITLLLPQGDAESTASPVTREQHTRERSA